MTFQVFENVKTLQKSCLNHHPMASGVCKIIIWDRCCQDLIVYIGWWLHMSWLHMSQEHEHMTAAQTYTQSPSMTWAKNLQKICWHLKT